MTSPGTYQHQQRAEKRFRIIIPVVLLIILLIIYQQFKSYSITLIILSSIWIACSGGFILLWLYTQPWFMNMEMGGIHIQELFNIGPLHLSVAVWVGFIALFGIATDDGVLMSTYLQQLFQKRNPSTKSAIHETIIEAGQRRIRPCLMTTATTLLALLPILTSEGERL